ncbi:hypothetical protein TNIN_423561 [Trichonephila inaurata madagascariensis]|uniref:Uncharacterized protein n=1 Tax=Trichonephila inaurata madagascariensis TaxID=2747483 RepID=A0A8X6WSL2_9ARAC|nr:hypothetical protein TNIN_423561 [Trichonephila inaurata madagascariensis]
MGPPLQDRNESKQRVEDGVSVQRNAKSIASAGKIISSVFWETKGTLLIDYLEKSKSITSEYYSNPHDQLDAKICKRPALKKKKAFFSRTMQLRKKVHWRWENCGIRCSICWVIPLILMIWHPQLSMKG